MADTEKIVCITLCTAKRPKMLENCLQSLIRQEVPPGWRVKLAIVENDEIARSKAVVDKFDDRSTFEIAYATEPRRGIPIARNRTLDMALKMGADYLVFIDDDERAEPGWLNGFHQALAAHDADIFKGPVRLVYPPETPAWLDRVDKDVPPTGTPVGLVYTSNTLMCRHLADPAGLGLRFDEKMRFSGGSDSDFFRRAIDKGATAIAVREAVVSEEVPASRVTLRWQLQRVFRTRANALQIRIKRKGYMGTLLAYSAKSLAKLAEGLVLLPLAGLAYPFSRVTGGRLGVQAMRAFATVAGFTAALAGFMPEPYRQVDGH